MFLGVRAGKRDGRKFRVRFRRLLAGRAVFVCWIRWWEWRAGEPHPHTSTRRAGHVAVARGGLPSGAEAPCAGEGLRQGGSCALAGKRIQERTRNGDVWGALGK